MPNTGHLEDYESLQHGWHQMSGEPKSKPWCHLLHNLFLQNATFALGFVYKYHLEVKSLVFCFCQPACVCVCTFVYLPLSALCIGKQKMLQLSTAPHDLFNLSATWDSLALQGLSLRKWSIKLIRENKKKKEREITCLKGGRNSWGKKKSRRWEADGLLTAFQKWIKQQA